MALPQRAALIAVLATVFAAILYVGSAAGHPPYGVLFANLDSEDAGAVTGKLREQKIDYRLTHEGHTIEVPEDKVYDLRLSLASEGMPRGGSVGFELFDKTNFGATDFTQHLNYQRALQGELTRTIDKLEGVVGSRVHLAIPEKRLLEDKEEPATASVVLHVRPGYQMNERQIAGIVHLVSSAVEGLKPENVSVHDEQGDLLSTGGASSPMLTSSQIQLQERYERRLASELQRLADEVLGPNKAAIRVSADLNWDQTETTSETYRPSGQAGKNLATEEQSNHESFVRTITPAAGIPGAASNVTATQGASPQPGQYTNAQTTSHYVVNKVVERRVTAPGKIRRLSVAVMLDAAVSRDQQVALKNAFAAGAGLDTAPPTSGGRGDRIELLPMKFDRTAEAQVARAEQSAEKSRVRSDLYRNIAAGVIAFIVGLVTLLLARRAAAPPRPRIDALIVDDGGTEPEELSLPLVESETAPRLLAPMDRVRQTASEDPQQVARQIEAWIAGS